MSGTTRPQGAAADAAAPPVIRSAGIALVGSALGGLLVIGNEMLAASFLDVKQYGLYAAGMTLARLCEALAIFGLPVTLFHFVPAWRQQGARAHIAGAVRLVAALPLLIGLGLGATLWLAAPRLGPWMFGSAEVVPFLRLLALAVPFMALTEVLGATTRAFGHAWYYVLVRNLLPPVLFLLALLAMRTREAPPLAVPASWGLAFAISGVLGAAMVARVAGADLWRLRQPWPRRELLGYAGGVMANSSLYIVFALTGILALGFFRGSDEVGVYRVCLQLVVPFELVMLAFHAATGPVYPLLLRGDDPQALEDAYGLALRGMAVLMLPLGMALAWNAPEILALAGAGFVEGTAALRTLAVGFALFTAFGTVAYLLMLSNRRWHEVRNAAVATALNIVLCLILVPRLGTLGAAASTIGAFAILNLVRIHQARRLLGLATLKPAFLRLVIVGVMAPLASQAALALAGVMQQATLPALAGRLLVLAACQAIALWFLGLPAADKDRLRLLAARVLQRRSVGRR